MKRIAALFLITVLVFTALPLSVFSADDSLAQTKAALESKYGINIEYPTGSDGEALITAASFETLDKALENLTPAVVKQVSNYYKNKNGNRITVSYVKSSSMGSDNATMANFYPDSSKIELYVPTSSGTVLFTGESPVNIVHEFGHAIHFMFTDSYGAEKMQSEWTAFNGGLAYRKSNAENNNPDNKVFVSDYAASDYYEDVAEVIGHAFIRYQAGQGLRDRMTVNGNQTGLGKKVAYVEKMLAACISEPDAMLNNFRRMYNASPSVSYQGKKFTGDHLQYIGYPQPRYVLNGSMRSFGYERQSAAWVRELGGWYVVATTGERLMVFPGGWYAEVGANFVIPGL